MSYMSKENILRNLSTLSYVPVVGHLLKKDDDTGYYMGGHDFEQTENQDLHPLTVPFGVVKNDSFAFEEVTEQGTAAQYLTAEIILWTGRYPELKNAVYSKDLYFSQSMELTVEQYRPYPQDPNYIELTDWTYSALCLLGKSDDPQSPAHTQPCFIESKVIPLQQEFTQDTYQKILQELKKELAFYFEKTPTPPPPAPTPDPKPETETPKTYKKKRQLLEKTLQTWATNQSTPAQYWLTDYDTKKIHILKCHQTEESPLKKTQGTLTYTTNPTYTKIKITGDFQEPPETHPQNPPTTQSIDPSTDPFIDQSTLQTTNQSPTPSTPPEQNYTTLPPTPSTVVKIPYETYQTIEDEYGGILSTYYKR